MACKNICKLCDRLILSTYVVWDTANSRIVVGLPSGTYYNDQKYCIVIAQPIPIAATINAPVVAQIGTSTVAYPIVNCDCSPLTACGIRSRTKYSTTLATTGAGASFRILGKVKCCVDGVQTISG